MNRLLHRTAQSRPPRPDLRWPRSLTLIALSELFERFAFFGVKGMLFLYLRERLSDGQSVRTIWGLAWLKATLAAGAAQTEPSQFASTLFGLYACLIYVSVIIAGLATDRWRGARPAVVLCGGIGALGYALMAFEPAFLVGMALVILGSGGFKGNIIAEFSARLPWTDARRDDAFRLFYIAMHIGLVAAPVICGTLGQTLGWRWGFSAAACGMVASLLAYLPVANARPGPKAPAPIADGAPALGGWTWRKTAAFAVLMAILATALIGSQQIYNAYLGWAQGAIKLSWGGRAMPTTWLLALDSALELLMLFGTVAFWRWWRRSRAEPDALVKIAVACFLIALAFGCLVLVPERQGPYTVALLLGFHALNGLGYAIMFPAALAFITRCAPEGSRATLPGLFYLQFAIAALAAGALGRWLDVMSGPQFWALHAATAAGAGVLSLGLGRWIYASLNPAQQGSARRGTVRDCKPSLAA